MNHQSPRPKNSGRRRNGRNGTPQKTYASENDATNYRHNLSDSPFTPQKLASQQDLPHQQAQTTNSKPRTRNSSNKKIKVKQGRHSPSDQPALPSAYAGTSFHASPAPTALPLPSFLARTSSAPDSPNPKPPAPGPSQQLSPPTTDSEENSSPSPHLPALVDERNEDSPLDFFFKADRAEKARARRASSAHAAAYTSGPFSPPHDSPQECSTFPRLNAVPPKARPAIQRDPSSGIPTSELDGTPGKPLGQAFSTPYSERIKAAVSKNNSVQVTPSALKDDSIDRSEALKRFLGVQAPMSPQSTQQTPPKPVQQKLPRGVLPASILTRGAAKPRSPSQLQSPPATATGVNHRSSQMDPEIDQVRRMEDSLRRVLKLGPAA